MTLTASLVAACSGGRIAAESSNATTGNDAAISSSEGTFTEGGATLGAGAKCGPNPAKLVNFDSLARQVGALAIGAMQIAVDDANVYFAFGGALRRVAIRGGPVSAMLALQANLIQNNDPVPTSTSVLLHRTAAGNSANNEEIVSVPKTGGQPTTLATSNGSVDAFTATETAAYFADQDGIKSVPTRGGDVQILLAQTNPRANGLAVVGSNLVVTANASALAPGSGEVLSLPIQGGAPVTIATQQPNAQFPMACGPDICWWTGAPASPMGPTGPGYIARLANGNITTVSAPVYPWSLVFDGSNFFETVGCDLCPGTLVRISLSGDTPVPMTSAGFAAVDEECAYFSVADGFNLASFTDGGVPGSGIFSVDKSYALPSAVSSDQ